MRGKDLPSAMDLLVRSSSSISSSISDSISDLISSSDFTVLALCLRSHTIIITLIFLKF